MRRRTGFLIQRGKIYYACWTLGGRKFMRSTGKTNRREAEVELHRIMEPFLAGDEVTCLQNIAARIEGRKAELTRLEDDRNPPLRLDRAWETYIAAPNRPDSGERTIEDYHGYFEAFANWLKEEHPSSTALRDVTPEIAGQYAAHLVKRRLSANSYNKHLRFQELFFRVLKGPARLAENPWEGMQRKRVMSESRRELTIDELREVCRTASGEMQSLLALGLFCGLRLKDAALLQWGEVDLQRGVIRRVPSKTARRKPRPVILPIHPSLREMLAETPAKDRRGDVLPETAALYRTRRDTLIRRIQAHFENCNIETVEPGTGRGTGKRAIVRVGFHSLRHSFVSLCREANAPLSVVESLVGHSNPTMTRLYSHTSEDAARAAVLSLPPVIEDSPAESVPSVKLIEAAKVRSLAEKLDVRHWRRIRSQLLEMTQEGHS